MVNELVLGSLIGTTTSIVGAIIALKGYSRVQRNDLIEQVKKDTELHMKLDFMTAKLLEGNNDNKVQFERIHERLDLHEKRIIENEQRILRIQDKFIKE